MRCPTCKFDDTAVRDSRLVEFGACVKRRRFCQSCDAKFTTHERVVFKAVQVRKRSGVLKDFEREKLFHSVYVAARKCDLSSERLNLMVESIMIGVDKESEKSGGVVSTVFIGEMVLEELRHTDTVAYVRYASVYKKFRSVKEFSDFILSIACPVP